MKLTKVQEAIKVLQASVEDVPVATKVKAKENVRTTKTKKVARAKN
jgi:hypothetical protein